MNLTVAVIISESWLSCESVTFFGYGVTFKVTSRFIYNSGLSRKIPIIFVILDLGIHNGAFSLQTGLAQFLFSRKYVTKKSIGKVSHMPARIETVLVCPTSTLLLLPLI